MLGGEKTAQARAAYRREPRWAAPLLWRSEFRSVLGVHLRRKSLTRDDALALLDRAEELLAGFEYLVRSEDVLALLASSRCSAYDCEFAALARELRAPLVTSDRLILAEFPGLAVSLEAFAETG